MFTPIKRPKLINKVTTNELVNVKEYGIIPNILKNKTRTKMAKIIGKYMYCITRKLSTIIDLTNLKSSN